VGLCLLSLGDVSEPWLRRNGSVEVKTIGFGGYLGYTIFS
jgi:hypothetical protein